jgi:hypothetical protein
LDATSGAGVCTLSGTNGSTVNYTAIGNCVIDANQAGNTTYAAATAVTQSVGVSLVPQTITFAALAATTMAQSPVTVSATASSTLPVTFTSGTPTVCTAGGTNGSTITLLKAGTCSVVANQAGNATFGPAPAVTQSFTVTAVAQTITFAALAATTMAQSPVTVAATASSALPVTFTSGTPTVCTAGGTNGSTITLLKAGTCSVVANQAGNATFGPAPAVTQSFTVTAVAQTITFAALAAKTMAQSPVTVAATASSTLPVTFTSGTPTVCTAGGTNGSTITLLKAGTCSVVANQAGNATFGPAPAVTQSFTVSLSAQTITFAALAAKTTAQSPMTVSATASSTLPVTFTTTTPTVCTAGGTNGSTITLLTGGTCSVVANQAGNATFGPAPAVTQSFTVTAAAAPTSSVISPSSGATVSGTSVLFDASASNASSVKFVLIGGAFGFAGPTVCTATPTFFGWACQWNSTTVPNNSYIVVSVASNGTTTVNSVGPIIKVSN